MEAIMQQFKQAINEIAKNINKCLKSEHVTGDLRSSIEELSKQVKELKIEQISAVRIQQITSLLINSLMFMSHGLHSLCSGEDRLDEAGIIAKNCELLARIIKDISALPRGIPENLGFVPLV